MQKATDAFNWNVFISYELPLEKSIAQIIQV